MNKERRYPPHEPYEPHKPERSEFNNFGSGPEKSIYNDIEILTEQYEGNEEEFFENFFDGEEIQKPAINYGNITLQDIIDLAPPEAKLSDIRLRIDWPRYMDYISVGFTYSKRDIDTEEKAYLKAISKYNEEYSKYQIELDKYNKELSEYESWKNDQEVKELEEKLAKAKNRSKP